VPLYKLEQLWFLRC